MSRQSLYLADFFARAWCDTSSIFKQNKANLNSEFFFSNTVAKLAAKYTDCISVEVRDPPPNECPGYDTKQSDGEASSPSDYLVSYPNHSLGNAECPFIVIVPRSTLARSGSTW